MGEWLAQVTSCEWQNQNLSPEHFLPEHCRACGGGLETTSVDRGSLDAQTLSDWTDISMNRGPA